MQFCSLGEIFPTHIRAKGVVVGVATICGINILWLQVAPIAFRTIEYKFYMVFCIPGAFAAAWLWFFFPNTLGIPLEEIAKIFGDADELYTPAGSLEEEKEKESKVANSEVKGMDASHIEKL